LKIISTKKWELLQADLAQARREKQAMAEVLKMYVPLDKHLKSKGITLDDIANSRAHVSWNPKQAPRVNVREMMEVAA